MRETNSVWPLVLAAGEGSRLQALTTTDSGMSVPKQFCSLFDGPTLLHEALRRADSLADESRMCVIVAEQHRQWWPEALAALPDRNVIVQPCNRGTAIGILLPLLQILERDRHAQLVLLPSDHAVCQEAVLTDALRAALARLSSRPGEPVLMGIVPEEVDPELGYIVPGERDGQGARTVVRFVEKPPLAQARELIGAGALWNTFIVAAAGQALLNLLRARIGDIVSAMEAAIARDRAHPHAGALAALYERLPSVDFSRDIVAGQEATLRVLAVPPCGWSDLGTPQRVAEALRRRPQSAPRSAPSGSGAWLSLAVQHHRLQMRHHPAGA
jgi:mannose-1-phosphate guanylyltransferase